MITFLIVNLLVNLTRSKILRFCLIGLLPFGCLTASANTTSMSITETIEDKNTLSGYVEDMDTGERLIGAHVLVEDLSTGTTTNEYGFFSLTLEGNQVYNIQVSYLGYTSQHHHISLKDDIQINFQLGLDNTLEAVEVVSSALTDDVIEASQMSSIVVPIETIEDLPALGGEVDVLRTLQLLPGISSGGEGASGLFVRGGSPDQNLVLLDGVPVYNASHLFGFLSVFNSDAINNMELIKGGFPARYGGRLSSVLDIRMKEGNMKEFAGRAAISPIASKIMLEGPIVKDKISAMITGRRTFLDLFLGRPKTNSFGSTFEKTSSKYFFYDFNGKINYKISERDRLYLSFYGGKDRFSNNSTYISDLESSNRYEDDANTGLDWGNLIGAFRWNHLFSDKLFANLTLNYSQYQLGVLNATADRSFEGNIKINESLYELQYNSDVQDLTARVDFSYVPSTKHYLRWGLGLTQHRFLPGASTVKNRHAELGLAIDTTYNNNGVDATEFSAYVEDDFQIYNSIKLNVGVHSMFYSVGKKTYSSVQPRASVRLKVTPTLAFKGALSATTQPLHLLTSSGVGLPTDLWISPTEKIKPQDAWQAAVGVNHLLSKGWDVSLEGYYKEMDNLVNYREGTSLLASTEGIEDKVTFGKGTSKGAELLLRKSEGKMTGWVSYALSWTDRTFPEINFGRTFSYDNDRRHDLSISVLHRFSERFRMSASWVITSGKPYTLPTRQFDAGNTLANPGDNQLSYEPVALDYSGKNNYRLPTFHRLDISVGWYKQKHWGERSIHVGLYNAYNRANTFYITRGLYSEAEGLKYRYRSVSLFPVIPGVSYQIKF